MKRALLTLVVVVAGCGGSGGGDDTGPDPTTDGGVERPKDPPAVDIVVDANRNGVLEPTSPSEQADDSFTTTSGAIFLANADDDDGDKKRDSEDEVVNGADDELDLARLQIHPWAKAPEGATGVLKVDTASQARVRLFRIAPEGTTVVPTQGLALTAADLRAGVELGIESKSFALPTWNGDVTVELVVTSAAGAELGKDSAVMRVAPFILQSDVQAPRTVYFADLRDPGHRRFQAQVTEGVVAGGAVARPIDSFKTEYTQRGQPDQWTQDHWTIGYTSMPVAGGVQRVMDVVLRAATEPRPAADFASVELLGHDVGYVHPRATDDPQTHDVSMDSHGNLDVVPPYTLGTASYPLGRILAGEGEFRKPDQTLKAYLEAQRVQPVININTEWLEVGHVDEMVSFVRTNGNARGWKLFVASPKLARQMLMTAAAANGGAVLFEGKNWVDFRTGREIPAQITIDAILADADLMQANQEAQQWIDDALVILKREVGLTDDDIVEVPFLYKSEQFGDGQGGSISLYIAYIPGTVNQLVVGQHTVPPDPFGPIINGQDIFKADLVARYATLGVTPHFADAWDDYHRLSGEVHCGTNKLRDASTIKWWELGK